MELEEIVNCRLSLLQSSKDKWADRLFVGRSLNWTLMERTWNESLNEHLLETASTTLNWHNNRNNNSQ
jgi:hypothetical protein